MRTGCTIIAVFLLVATAAAAAATATAAPPGALTLHYDKPAAVWTEALPIGNGRLGAMVFGKPDEELLQLNEATLWSGGPVSGNVNPGAFDALAEVRAALAKQDTPPATPCRARSRAATRKAIYRWATSPSART